MCASSFDNELDNFVAMETRPKTTCCTNLPIRERVEMVCLAINYRHFSSVQTKGLPVCVFAYVWRGDGRHLFRLSFLGDRKGSSLVGLEEEIRKTGKGGRRLSHTLHTKETKKRRLSRLHRNLSPENLIISVRICGRQGRAGKTETKWKKDTSVKCTSMHGCVWVGGFWD